MNREILMNGRFEGVMRAMKSWQCMLLAVLAATLVVPANADRPARPTRYMTVAPDGLSLFIMVPAAQRDGVQVAAHGVASRLTETGDLEPLWSVEGWYAKTHLAAGGELLVREGPWASAEPDQELAIAFYDRGREIRRYVVADLLRDPKSIIRSVSHYQWQGREAGYPRLTGSGGFLLTTVEGDLLTFDVHTGEIIDRRPAAD